jgi:hypothetical protein
MAMPASGETHHSITCAASENGNMRDSFSYRPSSLILNSWTIGRRATVIDRVTGSIGG